LAARASTGVTTVDHWLCCLWGGRSVQGGRRGARGTRGPLSAPSLGREGVKGVNFENGVYVAYAPYKLGQTRAVMIEGPSREAIELVEVTG
jgi:hypothetical protein